MLASAFSISIRTPSSGESDRLKRAGRAPRRIACETISGCWKRVERVRIAGVWSEG